MALLTSSLSGYDYDKNKNHSDLDRQMLREQAPNARHLNPFSGYYRYKLIEKKTGKLYRIILVPKVTRYNSLDTRYAGAYDYEPYPYKTVSIRKVYWLLKTIWQNRLDIFRGIMSSPVSVQIWIVIRSVIVLLIAYTIWALFQDDILRVVHGLFKI